MASSGPVAIRISEQMLIDRGILAKPFFKYVPMTANKPAKLFKSTPWQKAYEVGIVGHEWRNKVMIAECIRAARYGLSSMVLIQHKAHGKALESMMQTAGLRAEFIFGEDNQTERKAALQRLAAGKIDVLIGSTILDVGVDVPAIGLVVLGGGGKAEVALRQRIGRGLREKKGKLWNGDKMPNVAFIVDFADDHNNHLRGHYKQRRTIVESTPGFAENIVSDFDYAGLGFERKAA
jgi:superfamily II DNA or RNA helicase